MPGSSQASLGVRLGIASIVRPNRPLMCSVAQKNTKEEEKAFSLRNPTPGVPEGSSRSWGLRTHSRKKLPKKSVPRLAYEDNVTTETLFVVKHDIVRFFGNKSGLSSEKVTKFAEANDINSYKLTLSLRLQHLTVTTANRILFHGQPAHFLPRDAMLARYGPVSVCVCSSRAGILSKRPHESSVLVRGFLPSFLLHCVVKKFC